MSQETAGMPRSMERLTVSTASRRRASSCSASTPHSRSTYSAVNPPFSTQGFCIRNSQMLVADGHKSGVTHIRKAKPDVATISSAYSGQGLCLTAQERDLAKENRYPVGSWMPSQVTFNVFIRVFSFRWGRGWFRGMSGSVRGSARIGTRLYRHTRCPAARRSG